MPSLETSRARASRRASANPTRRPLLLVVELECRRADAVGEGQRGHVVKRRVLVVRALRRL